MLIASSAQATSFYPQPFPEAVLQAPTIVRGKVGSTYSDWNSGPENSRQIFTYYEMGVSEVLKGNVPNSATITIREIGGEKDGIGMQVAGTAHFSIGEDVVVFMAEKAEDGSFPVHGLMMGKFNLETQSNGTETLVGPAFLNQGGDPQQVTKKWTLQDLKNLIRTQKDTSKAAKSPPVVPPLPSIITTEKQTAPLPDVQPAASQLQTQSFVDQPYLKILLILAAAVGMGLLIWLVRLVLKK
jgi:hypothetical protein